MYDYTIVAKKQVKIGIGSSIVDVYDIDINGVGLIKDVVNARIDREGGKERVYVEYYINNDIVGRLYKPDPRIMPLVECFTEVA